MMLLLRVTCDEVMEKMNKENQVIGGFEVPNWHSTKRHRTTMCTVVCTYLMCILLNASWHIKAMLWYRFQTLEQKPRPRSQSYIRPTSVGPDTTSFPSPHPLSSPSLFPSFTHTVLPCIHVLLYMYMYMVMELYAKCMFALLQVRKAIMTSYRHCWEWVLT